jgi:preprotein translocase subunit SecD
MGRQRSLLAIIMVLAIASILLIIQFPMRLGLDLQGGSQITLELQTTDAVQKITADKVEAVQRVVENRINGLGVAEALVQTVNENQLVIQLPGVTNPEQAERVLGGTAQLDFRAQKAGSENELSVRFTERQERQVALLLAEQDKAGKPEVVEQKKKELATTETAIADLFQKGELSGNELTNAIAVPSGTNAWKVNINFNDKGGKLFADLTKGVAGTGRSLGIFLDNKLISAPRVDAQYGTLGITGGNAEISGGFTSDAAKELEIQLRGGSLPVPVKIVENRVVGASLGRDSIQRSINAAIAGLILVLIFMVWYYRLPGAIADIALVLYTIFNLGVYAVLGLLGYTFTLTLPGIAGFILSIGMAVDANVLIFERTREELQSGKTLYRSVESGFNRAFSSILDGNVTTLISCVALFVLGTGLVKGFAVTLAIGIVISMFTALTCSRTLLMAVVLDFPKLRKPHWFAPNLPMDAWQKKASSTSSN